MNYRHSYHVGDFADVFKHLVLLALLEALSEKDKPWGYLETHAGSGLYDLNSAMVQKTKKYENGIAKLMTPAELGKSIPDLVQKYLSIIKQYQYPHYYPGSPLIARTLAGPKDSLILLELHSKEFGQLKDIFKNDKQVSLHHQEGYQGIKAFLPLKERRGLIFIDPPFEKNEEWEDMLNALKTGLKRFETGVYALWYPIKDKEAVLQFKRGLKKLSAKSLIAELSVYPEDAPLGLIGSGMAIINPPFQLKNRLEESVAYLWRILSHNRTGAYRLE